ncbi:hypothetical protein K504DRAFT_472613 [Pleomassaria siparia CBS 279.74]|uniref:Glycine amidinotransferase, mitochondrial n=1 Tax=Pleomassaria siparia CBS 279.74 TaxID=1314801 RepID=A0A6G1KJZ4_9PLEO|nr:hypothetical protein K504DRAFT_472613 [Pleomassaria siparia CBS 279.74]
MFKSSPLLMRRACVRDRSYVSLHVQRFRFRPKSPFPEKLLEGSDAELNFLADALEKEGYQVGGYTAAMPRDSLMTVGNTIIEAPFSWGSRKREVDLAYSGVLKELEKEGSITIVRAPKIFGVDTIYDDIGPVQEGVQKSGKNGNHVWAINNSRVVIGQYSNVTTHKGVEYLRACVPDGYTVEILEVNDPHAMHIDATILPLKQGLLVYNPLRTSEIALRRHSVLREWDLRPYPFVPRKRETPPLFTTWEWLCMNALSISEKKVLIEEKDIQLAEWVRQFGIKAIPLPLQHVHSIGGSFHCATVDLIRHGVIS